MYKFFKRTFDIVLALLILQLLWPIFLLAALAVKIDSEGPVIFKQQRLGLNGRVFNLYKFRSMCVGAEKGGVYSDNKDTRITKVGNILR